MSISHLAFNGLLYAHPVLESMVAVVMLRRNLRRVFPMFFTYIVVQIAVFAVAIPVYAWGSSDLYFYVFWSCMALNVALGFKVLHEIFLDVFRPYHTLKDLGTVLFRWAGLVMLLVAGVIAASTPAQDAAPLMQAILTAQRCVRLVQVGLVLFLLVFSSYLGVSWRQRSFGIALGFGGFASIELGWAALQASGLSYLSASTTNLINMGTWNVAILVWFVYMWRESPARESGAALLKSQRWDRSLGELQHPVPADSLIPMFEDMVERALSRASSDCDAPADELVEQQPLKKF
jgi:hypothetical protein